MIEKIEQLLESLLYEIELMNWLKVIELEYNHPDKDGIANYITQWRERKSLGVKKSEIDFDEERLFPEKGL